MKYTKELTMHKWEFTEGELIEIVTSSIGTSTPEGKASFHQFIPMTAPSKHFFHLTIEEEQSTFEREVLKVITDDLNQGGILRSLLKAR